MSTKSKNRGSAFNFVITKENIEKILNSKIINPGLYANILKSIVDEKYDYKYCLEVLNILISQNKLKWRHLKITIQYLKDNVVDFINYYNRIIKPNIEISSIMIHDIINYYPYLIQYHIGTYIDLPITEIDENILTKYNHKKYDEVCDIDNDYNDAALNIKQFIINKYGSFKIFNKYIPEGCKYDVAIDGNNVLLRTGKLCNRDYQLLKKMYNRCCKNGYDPIIFIHKRHIKNLKKLEGDELPFNYVATPFGYDDDWFTLYYGVSNNIPIISNDLYRDHIYRFDKSHNTDELKTYLGHKLYKYNIINPKLLLKPKVLPIIIETNNYIYIPLSNSHNKSLKIPKL